MFRLPFNAKIDEIKIQIQQIHNNGTEIYDICLQETWLSNELDTSLVEIRGFQLISQGKCCSSRAGLFIYLQNNINYKVLQICPTSTIWEGQFIEIIGNNVPPTKMVLGNIYRPPVDTNENYKQFISEFTPLLSYLDQRKCDVIIGGDFNSNLLKINNKQIINEYLDMVICYGFFPKISLPTRLSDRNGTLIDYFLSKFIHNYSHISAGILVCRISHHFPYFLQLNYEIAKRVSSPSYVRERQTNSENLLLFKSEIIKSHLQDKINVNTSIDIKYDIFQDTITHVINKHLPIKQVKIHKHKHRKSHWKTKGIIRSIKFRDNLYMQLKKTHIDSIEYRYKLLDLKTYNTILRINIRLAKRCYYHSRFEKYKHYIKNTWVTIK